MDQETITALEADRKNMCETLKTSENPLFRARAANGLQHYHGSLEEIFDSNLVMLFCSATEKDPTVQQAMQSSIIMLCGRALGMSSNPQERDKIKKQLLATYYMDV